MNVSDNELHIRCIQPSDERAYFDIYSHPEVCRYDDFEPIGRDEMPEIMNRILQYKDDSLNIEYAVAKMPDDLMIGILTLDKKRKYCYLGYHFNPLYHGKGYAIRSVKLLLANLSTDNIKFLRVVVDPDNEASIKLALKAGFVKEKRRIVKGVKEIVYKLA